jgi:anti-sigma factor RsiW
MEYVDGELAPGESSAVRTHLDECLECREAVEGLSHQKARLRAVLASLDVESAPAAARTTLRLRERAASVHTKPLTPSQPQSVPASQPQTLSRRWLATRRQLAQAAVFVLFVAGGVSALVPGSPLRRLLTGAPEAPQETAPSIAPQTSPTERSVAESAPPLRVRAGQAAGSLRVSLQMTSGSELTVALVDGDSAAVDAPVDARLAGTDGLVEATAPTGPVRVELPRSVADVSLEVGGRLYLTVRSGRLEVSAPTTSRSESQVSFRIP